LLTDFEPLFDGILGAWKTTPVSFEFKEGARKYHGWAFPIPKVHKETIMKEIRRLIELGVFEWQLSSEWAAPSFIQPKKNGTVRFLTDFRELNKRLVRKPFPLPEKKSVPFCKSSFLKDVFQRLCFMIFHLRFCFVSNNTLHPRSSTPHEPSHHPQSLLILSLEYDPHSTRLFVLFTHYHLLMR
jgi:hypothetical protein